MPMMLLMLMLMLTKFTWEQAAKPIQKIFEKQY